MGWGLISVELLIGVKRSGGYALRKALALGQALAIVLLLMHELVGSEDEVSGVQGAVQKLCYGNFAEDGDLLW